jgi:hypothetical protein
MKVGEFLPLLLDYGSWGYLEEQVRPVMDAISVDV